ncbi:hypothetical protein NQ315_003713 [Exocentrus adspersus]|uniref:CCHC-type domain-containing protein n=1 Tax=Exocentrus adspersus TaxID=1586481 RepID=A0AAV8V615_9CUCU|nr:hypothetical protein NQ315_003713 [Exocentrus adspersus]
MPVTRRQKAEMEDPMKQLMEMLSAMKASQEQMKKEMKRGQEEMKENMKRGQEEMKSSQEELKQDIKKSQEGTKRSQEEMKEDLKRGQEEMKQKLEDKLQEMKTTIEDSNTKLENKLKEFEEVVEEEITQVKEEVKAIEGELSHMKEDAKAVKKEMNKKMEDLGTKFRQLSTTGVIKTEGTVTTPTKVKAQLRSRRQRFEETLQQYEADISRMVNLAYPTAPAEVIEQLSVSSFIEGLRDPEIGQLVRLARHKTISEALAQALEIEAAKQASRGTSKIRQVKTYQYQDRERKVQRPSKNLVDSIKDVLEKFTDGQNSEDSTTNRRRPIRCWTCGVEGHVRSRCPQPPVEQNQGNAN